MDYERFPNRVGYAGLRNKKRHLHIEPGATQPVEPGLAYGHNVGLSGHRTQAREPLVEIGAVGEPWIYTG
jgi:hypothetical protein